MSRSLVWITGVSGGIGGALARSVPWQDTHVVGVSRSQPGFHLPSYEHIAADLAHPSGWESVRRSIEQSLAGPPVRRVAFVHCAATIRPMKFAGDADHDEYQDSVVLNSVAPQVLGKAFIDATESLPSDVPQFLVMMTTGSSEVYPGWSAYKAGKAALDEWVRVTAAAYRDSRPSLKVVAVSPGPVATGMQAEIREANIRDFPRRRKFEKLFEKDALATPEQVARSIWRLLEAPPADAVVELRNAPGYP